jgi:hypothetical protein
VRFDGRETEGQVHKTFGCRQCRSSPRSDLETSETCLFESEGTAVRPQARVATEYKAKTQARR